MKKAIIGLSGLVILSFVVILFINAQNNSQEVKKTKTEISACCAKSASAKECTKTAETKAVVCDPAKCKEAGCDMSKCKEAKCDPKTCSKNSSAIKCEAKTSDATSSSCSSSCPMKSTEKTK